MSRSPLKEQFAQISEGVLTRFSKATGTTDLLALKDHVVVKTQNFEAVVSARLTYRIETDQISAPRLKEGPDDADRMLEAHFRSIDEKDEWLEHHLGMSTIFEKRKSCTCHYSETCGGCSGQGRTRCDGCDGRGEVSCSSCNNGKVGCTAMGCNGGHQKCSGCYGSGYREVMVKQAMKDSFGNPMETRQTVSCGQCGGSGRGPMCYNCMGSGSVACRTCSGSSRVSCSSCGATGVQNCSGCSARGFNSYARTLVAQVETERTYVGDTAATIKVLRDLSTSFDRQLREAPKANLKQGSQGQAGRYSFTGEATYSYIQPEEELLVFAGRLNSPALISQNLFKAPLKTFEPLISGLEVGTLEETDLGREILGYLRGERAERGSLLQMYDSAGTLKACADKILPSIDRKITKGERRLRLKYLALSGLGALLVYFLPFQEALSKTGLGPVFQDLTNSSPWFWGAFITLWAMPVLVARLYRHSRRSRREARSRKILGASRKMKPARLLPMWLAAMVIQTSVLAGTSFLPEPFFPLPCQESDLGVETCLLVSVASPYIGAPMNLLKPITGGMGWDTSKPSLEGLDSFMRDYRNEGSY